MLLCLTKLQRHQSFNNVLTEFNVSVMLGGLLEFLMRKVSTDIVGFNPAFRTSCAGLIMLLASVFGSFDDKSLVPV